MIITLPEGDFERSVVADRPTEHVCIRGAGQGLTRIHVGTDPFGIELRGRVRSLEVSDLTITGNGEGTGIGCSSGTEVERFRAHRVEAFNLATGISMNADLGGFFRNARVEDCHVHDMPGESSGHGYGIHAANAEGVTIAGNLVERCSRHSIYQARTAKRSPAAVKIVGNTIREHRKGGSPGYIRCAVVVSRSSGVQVAFNQILDGWGGGLEVSADGESRTRPWPCDTVEVIGNQFTGRQDEVCYVMLGEQQVPPGFVLEDVSLLGNRFDTIHAGAPRQPDIWLLNGRNIRLANVHRHRGSDGATQRAITLGDARFGTSIEHLCGVDTQGSTFFYDDPKYARPITLDGPARLVSSEIISDVAEFFEP